MKIDHLTMTLFRNIMHARVNFSPHLTLLVGDNGQGKTNTLEAIYVLLTGTSFRSPKDQEQMMTFPAENADEFPVTSLEGVVHRNGDGILKISHRMRRHPVKKQHNGPVLPVVIFSPDDVQLSKGTPQGRRKFLDWLLAPMDVRYLRLFRQYHRALLQRNKALKDPRLHQVVSTFNPLLAQAGSYLWSSRIRILAEVVPLAQNIFTELTGLTLDISLAPGGTQNPATDPETYQKLLSEREHDEQLRGMTLIGPHRDELVFSINGFSALAYASQGQHRSIALAMKLASFEVLERETGMTPVVLLDDVLSELDPDKRSKLLRFIAQSRPQTIITDTEARNYENLDPIIYDISQGCLTKREI
ncbi:MAG: DNA replication and repair protein RecF [Firmicutes bacterium]|jgi:DNA replication and repair protein RecF|nr:DNA replication and repair protein RecF [Bacillota bacterium]